MTIRTFNSKTNLNGNRLNLVINEDLKEKYFAGGNTFNLGEVENGLGIREVQRLNKMFEEQGYQNVSWDHVAHGWMNYK